MYRFIYSGSWTEGIKISRLPFMHLQQLSQIMKILRQQLVFNALFTSCFSNDQYPSANASVNSKTN
jgi:hypothetical protein